MKDFVAPSLIIGVDESQDALDDAELSGGEGNIERLSGSDG